MAPYRKHQKVKKQDTDGLLHNNDAMTSAPNIIQQLVHYSVAHIFLDFLMLPVYDIWITSSPYGFCLRLTVSIVVVAFLFPMQMVSWR